MQIFLFSNLNKLVMMLMGNSNTNKIKIENVNENYYNKFGVGRDGVIQFQFIEVNKTEQ